MARDCTRSPEECDVSGRPTLERFRQKRAEWVHWLDDDPDHAIWQTIHGLVWREVTYSTIAHLGDGYPGGALNNRLIGEAILNGHVTLQVLAIRRLVDTTKGVVSLAHLVRDVRLNRPLMTRENYVCFDGLPYDYAEVQQEEFATFTGGVRWGQTSGPRAWSTSERVHAHFDALAGVTPGNRSRTDLIRPVIFNRLEEWLKESGAEEIAKWSHAYLAHAGSTSSRHALGDYGLRGNAIKATIRSLARIAEAVSSTVLYHGGRMNALMPTAQFDPFACLNNTAMRPGGLEAAARHWFEKGAEYDRLLGDVQKVILQN